MLKSLKAIGDLVFNIALEIRCKLSLVYFGIWGTAEVDFKVGKPSAGLVKRPGGAEVGAEDPNFLSSLGI